MLLNVAVLSRSCRPNTCILSARKRSRCQTTRGKLETSPLWLRGLQALAEEEGVQMLRDPVEAKQDLIDPGFQSVQRSHIQTRAWEVRGFHSAVAVETPFSFRGLGGEKE